MLLSLMCKLAPSDEQKAALIQTIERFNTACDWVAGIAFATKCAGKVRLQKMVYRELRARFGLSAQMAVRAIAKTCEAYKRDKGVRPAFLPRGAIPFDQRILSWRDTEEVSILTLSGRIEVKVKMGEFQRAHFRNARGQVDLILRGGRFYLGVVVDREANPAYEPQGALGVDLGIVNLAVDSEGRVYKGDRVDAIRVRIEKLKSALQRAGTKSAKRHLRAIRGRESRFRRHENHVIARELVSRAKDTRQAIALEDLRGIRAGTTVRRSQRRRQFSWAYRQLGEFIAYKAKLAGVPVVLVPPRGTSRECPRCRHEEKANRKSREEFECKRCGLAGPADHIAAVNIAARAAVNRPIVPRWFVVPHWGPQGQADFLEGNATPFRGS